jgi:hypothetical protein
MEDNSRVSDDSKYHRKRIACLSQKPIDLRPGSIGINYVCDRFSFAHLAR